MTDPTNSPIQKNLRSQTLLYRQGDRHPCVYRILKGYVVLGCDSGDGKSCVVDLLGEGDYFGPGLLRADTGTAQATYYALAKSGCQLELEKQRDFWNRLQSEPLTAIELAKNLACHEHRLRQQVSLLATAALEQRLAATLYRLFERVGQGCRHGHKLDIKFSQQELAHMVGSSRQSVSLLLADWRREGVIEYTRTYLCLESPEKLLAYTRQ